MKKTSRKGAKAQQGVVLTLKQADLLLSCAETWNIWFGLTPMERMLVGAARRRIKTALKRCGEQRDDTDRAVLVLRGV